MSDIKPAQTKLKESIRLETKYGMTVGYIHFNVVDADKGVITDVEFEGTNLTYKNWIIAAFKNAYKIYLTDITSYKEMQESFEGLTLACFYLNEKRNLIAHTDSDVKV